MSAKRLVWRMDDHADESDRVFKQTRQLVLERSASTCQFCTLRSTKYQEVHHIDDDHHNNSPQNLCCTCPLCHQVFHIGLAGIKDGGRVIYLPELSQAEVNQLALVIWIATAVESESNPITHRLAARAKMLESLLGARQGAVLLRLKKALEEQAVMPKELVAELKTNHLNLILWSNILMGLTDDEYERRADLLGGLRLLPSQDRFAERLVHWRTEQNAVLPLEAWHKIVSESDFMKIVGQCTDQLDLLMSQLKVSAG